LHEIAQLEERCLEDKQTLLQLRRENLLERQILRLKHSRARHAQRVTTALIAASKFRAAPPGERDLLSSFLLTLPMKKWMLLGMLAFFSATAGAQSPAPNDQKQLEEMIKAVQAQQIQIAENQAQIDTKLATLAEAIRIAKIYASRGGR
jgi:hypothetical protein